MGKRLATLTGQLTPGDRVEAALSGVPMPSPMLDPTTYPLATPWASGELNRIVADDVFGNQVPINTRNAAMRIPAVARSRNLLVSTIARFPLIAMRGATQLTSDETPTWMYATNRAMSPQHRLAWTVDDLIFYGWSCWSRVNGAGNFPVAYDHVARDRWTINADNRVVIDDMPVPDDSVTLIPGLHEGILSFGADVLRDAKALAKTVADRVKNPVPQTELHQTGGDPLTTTERDDLIRMWAAARQGANGGVGFTNELIELRTHGGDDGNLLIEARNAAAVDIARLVGVSAGRIDATTPKASLNYETTTGRNQELVDFDLALYMTPITARLSMDDVMPRGQRAAFDLSDFLAAAPSVTGPSVED